MIKKYSLIVIGGGIAGLSTALAWTRVYDPKKFPVLLLERNSTPGGCVSTFSREGFRFDTAQIIPDVSDLLDFFDIDVPLLKFNNYYARLFLANPIDNTTKILPIPSSRKDFELMLITKYPDDEKRIVKFFGYCTEMYYELEYLKTEPAWYDIPKILLKCPKIISNSKKTYKEFLSRFQFKNQEIYEILDTFSSFSGLSANRCAALLTACAMITTLQGAYRPEKGFIQFPIALRKKLESAGGEVLFRSGVRKIMHDGKKVSGVMLNSGEIIEADHVVSSADTKRTFERMLDPGLLFKLDKNYGKKVESARMSTSGFSIHLGLDDSLDLEGMGFNCGYNVLTTGNGTHAEMFDAWEKGELLMSDDRFHLAVICPSLMTGGKQTLIIHVIPVYADKWIRLKEEDPDRYVGEKNSVADFYIDKVEQYMVPGLRDHIVLTDISTPSTYVRYIGSPTGSQYDMMPVPENFGRYRLPSRTPLNGLFVPKFSHGIWPSMQAGLQIVDMISGGKIMNGNSKYKSGNKS
jgi:phytoene dehydrogenase-like protein